MKNKDRKYKQILEVRVVSTSIDRLLTVVTKKVVEKRKISIFTPNSEIILHAQADRNYKKTISQSDINIPDSVGVILASKFLELPNPKYKFSRIIVLPVQGIAVGMALIFNRSWLTKEMEVIKGREFFMRLVELANNHGWKVFLLGAEENVVTELKSKLEKKYKKAIFMADSGPFLSQKGIPITNKQAKVEKNTIGKINDFAPELLFVAFGAPKQEIWVTKHLNKLNVHLAMVVGGSFDYAVGDAKLPPYIFASSFEWLWRLFREPKRIGRVANAVIVFPIKVFLFKYKL